MKIETEKITNSKLPNEYDVRVKENHKIYGFILYEYHDEYTEENKWFLCYIGSYNKYDSLDKRPCVVYFGNKPCSEFEEETTYDDYKTTLEYMLNIIKNGEIW